MEQEIIKQEGSIELDKNKEQGRQDKIIQTILEKEIQKYIKENRIDLEKGVEKEGEQRIFRLYR